MPPKNPHNRRSTPHSAAKEFLAFMDRKVGIENPIPNAAPSYSGVFMLTGDHTYRDFLVDYLKNMEVKLIANDMACNASGTEEASLEQQLSNITFLMEMGGFEEGDAQTKFVQKVEPTIERLDSQRLWPKIIAIAEKVKENSALNKAEKNILQVSEQQIKGEIRGIVEMEQSLDSISDAADGLQRISGFAPDKRKEAVDYVDKAKHLGEAVEEIGRLLPPSGEDKNENQAVRQDLRYRLKAEAVLLDRLQNALVSFNRALGIRGEHRRG